MGAAFFSGGTKHIRDVLGDAFGPLNVQANGTSYGSLFNPTGGSTLAQIADTPNMDLPTTGDKHWPTLHVRFQKFLTALYQADPTTHTSIMTAMHNALTASPAMPMRFHVAHQNSGYNFVSWAEEDDSGVTWVNCLLFCPALTGPLAERLRRVTRRNRAHYTGRNQAGSRKGSRSKKKASTKSKS